MVKNQLCRLKIELLEINRLINCKLHLLSVFVAVLLPTTLCLKNDTDLAQNNFNAHQPILVVFGRNIAQ